MIDLSEDDEDAVELMIKALYTSVLTENTEASLARLKTSYSAKPSLDLLVKVYTLADKYDIPRLRHEAAANVGMELDNSLIAGSFDDLLTNIPRVYNCTPESDKLLREVVVGHVRYFYKQIVKEAPRADQLREVISTVPQFAVDLVDVLVKRPLLEWCEDCGNVKDPDDGLHTGDDLHCRCPSGV